VKHTVSICLVLYALGTFDVWPIFDAAQSCNSRKVRSHLSSSSSHGLIFLIMWNSTLCLVLNALGASTFFLVSPILFSSVGGHTVSQSVHGSRHNNIVCVVLLVFAFESSCGTSWLRKLQI
jgi:hypothetical protein